jgi:UDP-glucose 4-epimerase
MTKVLITGGSGFIGKKLVDTLRLHDNKFKVFILLRSTPCINLHCENIHIVDFSNLDKLKMVMQKINPSIVIHLAYSKSRNERDIVMSKDYFLNLHMSSNVIEATRSLPSLSKFIFLGSCDEYGVQEDPYMEAQSERPLTSYGLSKLAITKTLMSLYLNEKFPSVVIRPSVVYGEGQGMDMFLPSLASSIINRSNFNMTKGNQYRDFIYINDLIDAILLVLEYFEAITGEVINISYGESYRLASVAKKFANMITPNGDSFLNIGVNSYRKSEVMDYHVSNIKAKKILHWYPKINLESGMKKVLLSLKK